MTIMTVCFILLNVICGYNAIIFHKVFLIIFHGNKHGKVVSNFAIMRLVTSNGSCNDNFKKKITIF